jgi:two-component system, cell cycle response regulator
MPGRDQRPNPVASPIEQKDQLDQLTGVYSRSEMLSLFFRETDRAQRMKTPLSLLILGLDDVAWWTGRLGRTIGDELLCEVVSRIQRQLRSYDVLGRVANDEFMAVLPGCSPADATLLAERLRVDVFARAFSIAHEAIQLSACFGIAPSNGRSPVVVLREARLALMKARETGPTAIHRFGSNPGEHGDSSSELWDEDEAFAP